MPSAVTIIFALWYTEIGLKCLATYRVYHTRLLREYPFLFLFLLCGVIKSLTLIQVRHSQAMYATVYSITIPLMLVLHYLCGIEIFERLTNHLPRFSKIGKYVLLGFAFFGILAVLSTRKIGVPQVWSGLPEAAVLLSRYALLSLFVGLALMALCMPRVRSGPMPRVAIRALVIMTFYVFCNAFFDTIVVQSNTSLRVIASIGTTAAGLVAAIGWLTLPASERSPDVPQSSPVSMLRDSVRRLRDWWPSITPRVSERP